MRRSSIILSLVLIALLAACRSGPAPTASPTPTLPPQETALPTASPTPTPLVFSGTVSIWHSWDEYKIPALLRVVAAFQAQYPDVQFDVTYVPLIDLLSSYQEAASAGGGPAILIGPAEWGPQLFDLGLVANLSQFTSQEVLDRLNLAARQTGEYNGALISLPQNIKGVVLYRNRAIIPQAPATWEELVDLAQAATHDQVVGAMLDRSFFYAGGHLVGLGGGWMDLNGSPVFNSQAGIDWLNLLRDFERAGPPDYFTDTDLTMFKEGRLGMMVDGTWNLRALSEALGEENISIDPWPITAQGELSGFVQAESIFLNPIAQGQSQLLALKFVEYFLSVDSQAALVGVGAVPAVTELPADTPYDDPLITQAMAALARGSAYPVQPEIGAYTSPIDIALQTVFAQGADPAAALQQAEEAVLAALGAMVTPEPTP